MFTQECRGCSPCAWASGHGSDCLITPYKLNFTSTKKTVVLLVHLSFDKKVSRSHLTVQPTIKNDCFITNISECSQRNQGNKADTWLAQFYRRINNNLNLRSFFSVGMCMFWHNQLHAWDGSHSLHPASHHTKGYRDHHFPNRKRA